MSVLQGFITNLGKYNEGELVGKWFAFPTDQETLDAALREIEIGPEYEEYFMTDYDCDISGVYKVLGEYESLRELNYLGHVLEELDDRQGEFEAVLDQHGASSIKDLINIAGSLDNFHIVGDISTETELGDFLVDNEFLDVPEHLLNYLDYEAIGRDHILNGSGSITKYGYVEGDGDIEDIYDGEEIPEEYDIQPVEPAPVQTQTMKFQ